MALAQRLETLKHRHEHLGRLIDREVSRPAANALNIARWKREKLFLKDVIQGLQDELNSENERRHA